MRSEFMQKMERLEKITARLEANDAPLEEAIVIFEEGLRLTKECREELNQAEGKVQVLLSKVKGAPREPQDLDL